MRSAQPNKAGIPLTHPQPFRSSESPYEKLVDRLRPTLSGGLIRAWFWGHEHRWAAYDPSPSIEYRRLFGDGGVSVGAPKSPAPTGVDYLYGTAEDDYLYRFGGEKFLRLGFVEL